MSRYSVDIPFRSFDKYTPIPKYDIIDWDLVVNGIPYSVAHMEGFIHTQGGKWGINDMWAWPRNEQPTYENLIPFNSEYPVCYSLSYSEQNVSRYSEHFWGDDCEIQACCGTWILRNGEPFYFVRGRMGYSLPKAQYLLFFINEGPINFNSINWKKDLIGRKIWYNNEPAIISSLTFDNSGGYELFIVPDGIKKFSCPEHWKGEKCLEDSWSDYENGLYCYILEITDKIEWFRY